MRGRESRNGTGGEQGARADRPVGVDLFAGAGGLALGFEQAGFDVLASVEYDPIHAATHKFNFPHAEIVCADVAALSSDDLREAIRRGWTAHERRGRWSGEIDAIFGGPPCQGFSSIGKRLVDDKRNQLVFHFFRLVSELRPRYFAMENVPGMARGGHASILAQLIAEFEEVGYRVVLPYRVLNAMDYGVPQDRERLFLLGARAGEPLPAYPIPTVRPVPKRSGGGCHALSLEDGSVPRGPSVWEAIGDLPDLDDFPELVRTDEARLRPEELARMEARASVYVRRLRGVAPDPEDFSYSRAWDRSMLTSSMRTRHTPVSIERFSITPTGETEPVSRFYRLDPDGLCNTLRAGTGSERGAFTSPRPIHPTLPRVLSVREAARLHSFPDWFRLHATKWHGFRQIGNAVAPLVGRAVAREIVSALRMAAPKPSRSLSLGDSQLLWLTMAKAAEHFGADKSAIPPPRARAKRNAPSGRVASMGG